MICLTCLALGAFIGLLAIGLPAIVCFWKFIQSESKDELTLTIEFPPHPPTAEGGDGSTVSVIGGEAVAVRGMGDWE